MFDRIALRYDQMNRLMTFGLDRRWRRAAVESLGLRPGELVLDLACGTGDLAGEAARHGALVIGFDLSAGMLAVARRRGIPGCMLVRGDALRLPIRDRALDAIVSGFALRNVVALQPVLVECARVLRPRGRIALLEIDTPSRPVVRAGHRIWLHRVVPVLGRALADAEAYDYLPSSLAYLPAEEELRRELAHAGFADIRKRTFLAGAVQLVTANRPGGLDV